MKSETKYPEFSAEGYALPEGTKPGQEFEVVATIKAKEDGRLCLVAVEGMPVDTAGPAPKEEDPKGEMIETLRGFYADEAGE